MYQNRCEQSHRFLSGKLAIVTGASRGIGAAISQSLASRGAAVILNYASESSAEQTNKLAADLQAQHGVKCLAVRADISQPAGSTSLIQAVKEHKFSDHHHQQSQAFQIDIIVNNAGVAVNAHLEKVTVEEFEWMYRVNVLGPILLMQAALEHLPHDRSARIINVSSISSTEGFVGQTVYGGTKAALNSMTRTWARELSSRGTVNAINPGPVKTDMWDSMPEEHRTGLKAWMEHTPMAAVRDGIDDESTVLESKLTGGRPAYPEEIAGIVGMLCLPESVWCTGQLICANGGMRMGI